MPLRQAVLVLEVGFIRTKLGVGVKWGSAFLGTREDEGSNPGEANRSIESTLIGILYFFRLYQPPYNSSSSVVLIICQTDWQVGVSGPAWVHIFTLVFSRCREHRELTGCLGGWHGFKPLSQYYIGTSSSVLKQTNQLIKLLHGADLTRKTVTHVKD